MAVGGTRPLELIGISGTVFWIKDRQVVDVFVASAAGEGLGWWGKVARDG